MKRKKRYQPLNSLCIVFVHKWTPRHQVLHGFLVCPKLAAGNNESNVIKDSLDALEIYRSKDLIKKAFGNLKERLNMRRTSVWSEENLEGKLFVQFLALIYLSYIKKAHVRQSVQRLHHAGVVGV